MTGATVHRLAFTTSLHRPDQVPHTARDLGLGALVAAALVLLVAFPSELFDSTLAENYDEVCGWFSFVRPLGRRLAALPRGAVAAGGLVVAAAIYGFADPGFGVGLSSLAELLGLVLALAVMTIAFGAPMAVFVRRRYGDPARLAVLPTGLLIAAGCVVVSRLLHFQPGYLYGAVIGLAFSRELGEREEGLLSSLSMVTMLGVAVLAWFAWAAVEPAAAGRHPSFSVVVLDAMLAAVTVSGIESVVVTMLPVRFMEGRRISRWDRRVWAVVFAAALFAFVEILLRPGAGYVSRAGQGSQVLVIVALLAFGGGSVLFWAYFRFRRPRAATTTTPQFP